MIGEKFKFPCGAEVIVTKLWKGLACIQIKHNTTSVATITDEYENILKHVELRFKPEAIPQLIRILQNLQATAEQMK